MKLLTVCENGDVRFNYNALDTRPGFGVLGHDLPEEVKMEAYAEIKQAIKTTGTHRWIFEAPPENTSESYLSQAGGIYLPEFRFGYALFLLDIAYSCLQGDGEVFNTLETRRWSRIDDNTIAIDMSYPNAEIPSLPDVSINQAYSPRNYTDATPDDWLVSACVRAFLKGNISCEVEEYYSDIYGYYRDWPVDILWVDNDTWVQNHPEIVEAE